MMLVPKRNSFDLFDDFFDDDFFPRHEFFSKKERNLMKTDIKENEGGYDLAVELPGYKRGFIGGASGRVGDEIWFNGDLNAHPDAQNIVNFICRCGLTVCWISDVPLVDIGSIIEESI